MKSNVTINESESANNYTGATQESQRDEATVPDQEHSTHVKSDRFKKRGAALVISQNDIMKEKILKNNQIFVMPDPKIVHREPIQPFDMCLDNIFDRDQFNEQKKKAAQKQMKKEQHVKYAKTGYSTSKLSNQKAKEDPYSQHMPRSQSINDIPKKKNRKVDYLGQERRDNRTQTQISDHVLRKPLRIMTIKLNEKDVFNQLRGQEVEKSKSLEARSIFDPVKKFNKKMRQIKN